MLFIQKTQPSQELIDFVIAERAKFQAEGNVDKYPSYLTLQSDKSYKSLREQLYKEQRGLCCYCMQKIALNNSTIEHFLPQSIFSENEVDYFNLYLACLHSKGKSKTNYHCDIIKGNNLISKFIGYSHHNQYTGKVIKCEDLIQYTEGGFILPNKAGFKTIDKFYRNYSSLTSQEKELLSTIDGLNLNCPSLVNEREKFIKTETKFKPFIDSISDVSTLKKILGNYEKQTIAFAGVAIYFLKERLKQLP